MLKALAERGKELIWNLGVQVLLPRLFVYGVVPLTLLIVHSPDGWSFTWFPGFGWIAALSGGLFLLNVWANFAVSGHLRLHQTNLSPYEYSEAYNRFTRKPYFRISVRDNTTFRSLIKSLQAEHKGEAISIWLRLDDLWLVPATLFLLLGLLLCGASWVVWQVFHPLGFRRQIRSWIGFWRQVRSQT